MRTERFNRAYDALVKAFFEGTLDYFDCERCAIGNMVLHATGKCGSDWFGYSYAKSFPINYPDGFDKSAGSRNAADAQLNAIGYSPDEAWEIEMAFGEGYTDGEDTPILQRQFNGLMLVVDVLLKLDNITPEDHYKNKFREHPQLIY